MRSGAETHCFQSELQIFLGMNLGLPFLPSSDANVGHLHLPDNLHKRTFAIPEEWAGERLSLNIEH